ncbi:hypothetical protein [Streptococcus suis]|nr:hypothetical protein [Streptococcus suis]
MLKCLLIGFGVIYILSSIWFFIELKRAPLMADDEVTIIDE